MLVLLHCFPLAAQQLYRFDNTAYKTVYWNDAVRLMSENKNYLLLDVRSAGEYADTSQYTHMNMGHIKGAVNINIDSIQQHLQALKRYSDQNIFVYCSHSQRSRRVSKLLSDNGFKKVYNINGGMSVANESTTAVFPLKNSAIVTNNAYKNIASRDALDLMQEPGVLVLDVRKQNEFISKDSQYSKNLGYIKNAVNIPVNGFQGKFKAMDISLSRTILVYDGDGSESADVAAEVSKMGYTAVYNLFEGLSGFMCDNYLEPSAKGKVLMDPPPFKVISARECIDLLSKPNDFLVIDARPAEEFNNRSEKEYLNVGRIKSAVNVPSEESLRAVVTNMSKTAPILVYGSYSGNNDDTICKALIQKGYKNVYFLYQGIGRFAWSCFNIENCKDGISVLTDHDGLY
jgi:rhodanese-related sulfurtransferase